jgi:hypothetical protein
MTADGLRLAAYGSGLIDALVYELYGLREEDYRGRQPS